MTNTGVTELFSTWYSLLIYFTGVCTSTWIPLLDYIFVSSQNTETMIYDFRGFSQGREWSKHSFFKLLVIFLALINFTLMSLWLYCFLKSCRESFSTNSQSYSTHISSKFQITFYSFAASIEKFRALTEARLFWCSVELEEKKTDLQKYMVSV